MQRHTVGSSEVLPLARKQVPPGQGYQLRHSKIAPFFTKVSKHLGNAYEVKIFFE